MNDDWRLRIELEEEGLARSLSEQLEADELEHELERSFADRVIVSAEGPEVFCYAGTREQAEQTAQVVRQIADRHGWRVLIALGRWHPVAERWEDPDAAEPAGLTETAEERAERIAQERAESAEQGYPEFEVRVQCPSRGEAGELSERLDQEGIPHLHRWSYLLIGATDEDSAGVLADRLRREAPAGCEVTVERNRRSIYDHRLWSPFTVLGGLGG